MSTAFHQETCPQETIIVAPQSSLTFHTFITGCEKSASQTRVLDEDQCIAEIFDGIREAENFRL